MSYQKYTPVVGRKESTRWAAPANSYDGNDWDDSYAYDGAEYEGDYSGPLNEVIEEEPEEDEPVRAHVGTQLHDTTQEEIPKGSLEDIYDSYEPETSEHPYAELARNNTHQSSEKEYQQQLEDDIMTTLSPGHSRNTSVDDTVDPELAALYKETTEFLNRPISALYDTTGPLNLRSDSDPRIAEILQPRLPDVEALNLGKSGEHEATQPVETARPVEATRSVEAGTSAAPSPSVDDIDSPTEIASVTSVKKVETPQPREIEVFDEEERATSEIPTISVEPDTPSWHNSQDDFHARSVSPEPEIPSPEPSDGSDSESSRSVVIPSIQIGQATPRSSVVIPSIQIGEATPSQSTSSVAHKSIEEESESESEPEPEPEPREPEEEPERARWQPDIKLDSTLDSNLDMELSRGFVDEANEPTSQEVDHGFVDEIPSDDDVDDEGSTDNEFESHETERSMSKSSQQASIISDAPLDSRQLEDVAELPPLDDKSPEPVRDTHSPPQMAKLSRPPVIDIKSVTAMPLNQRQDALWQLRVKEVDYSSQLSTWLETIYYGLDNKATVYTTGRPPEVEPKALPVAQQLGNTLSHSGYKTKDALGNLGERSSRKAKGILAMGKKFMRHKEAA